MSRYVRQLSLLPKSNIYNDLFFLAWSATSSWLKKWIYTLKTTQTYFPVFFSFCLSPQQQLLTRLFLSLFKLIISICIILLSIFSTHVAWLSNKKFPCLINQLWFLLRSLPLQNHKLWYIQYLFNVILVLRFSFW